MRLALIGCDGHWKTYQPGLASISGLSLVAVASSGPHEGIGGFDHAPGLTAETMRYEDAQEMLAKEKPDLVQVSCRPHLIPHWTLACLERKIPVLAEKPLAMDMTTLVKLYETAKRVGVAVMPMHTQRDSAELAATAKAVRSGLVGDPLMVHSQKTYKWGNNRPAYAKSRETFPGIVPFIGIHAIDWLMWILGDQFVEVQGRESITGHPEFKGCASHAGFVYQMASGGLITLSLDFLRPGGAPTHGDERVRIVGTRGLIETSLVERKATLTTDKPPAQLELTRQSDIFSAFARTFSSRQLAPMSMDEAFRITEVAIRTQEAADSGRLVSLKQSAFPARG